MFFNLSMLMDRLRIGGVKLIREHDGELRLTWVAMVAENAQSTTDAAIIVPTERIALLEKFDKTGDALSAKSIPEPWDVIRMEAEDILQAYEAVITAIFELNAWYEALSEAVIWQIPLQETLDIAAR